MKPSSLMTVADLDIIFFLFQPGNNLSLSDAQIKGQFMRLHTRVFARWPCACLRVRKKVNCLLAGSLWFWANLLSYPLLHLHWEARLIAFLLCVHLSQEDRLWMFNRSPPSPTGHLPPHHMIISSFH